MIGKAQADWRRNLAATFERGRGSSDTFSTRKAKIQFYTWSFFEEADTIWKEQAV